MIQNTFLHISGISKNREKLLWENQIYTWDDFLSTNKRVFGESLTQIVKWSLTLSQTSFNANDFQYFYEKLPANEHWRIYPHLQNQTAYLDIETTGHLYATNHITTICMYDGKELRTYVKGDNLYQFCKDIKDYQCIVTYNGKTFDIPFIEKDLGLKLKVVHLDVMHLLRALGVRGGLKNCEKQLGLHRGDLLDVDGYDAVILWERYKSTKKSKYLETLLAYNALDAINLEKLMIEVYLRNTKGLPFQPMEIQQAVKEFPIPFLPNTSVINEIRKLRSNW